MNIIGIDLGTTYSGLAVLDEIGRPEIVPNSDGERITPSVIFFDPDEEGRVEVGDEARKQMVLHPDHVVVEVKQRMGKVKSIDVGSSSLTPAEVSSLILKKLIQDAEKIKGKIDEAVITVPANFPEEARVATEEAGKLAGLKKVILVDEPVAAALQYATSQSVHGRVLVYDLGGGTFDVTIADIDGTDVKVITSQGDPNLGGKDFDRKLAALLSDKYKEKCGEAMFEGEPGHKLMDEAEDLKRTLSKKALKGPDKPARAVFMGPAGPQPLEVTPAEFEEAISTFISKAEGLIDVALDEAGIKESGIDHVLLVGGSTRIPCIQRRLEKRFGKEPSGEVNPDEAVALGAAIHAGLHADPGRLTTLQKEEMEKVNLRDVANHYYGTIVYQQSVTGEWELTNTIIIDKNTPIPCSGDNIFYTTHADQTAVNFTVTQSMAPEENPDFVTKISEAKLEALPPGRPADQEVKVEFSYDESKMMKCEFKDVATGKTTTVDIRPDDYQGAGGDTDDFTVE